MCNQPSSLPPTIRDRDSRQTRLHIACSPSYVCIGRCVCPIRHMWTWRSVPDVTNRRFIGAASRIQPPASVWSTRVRRPYSQTATEPESSPATSNSDMNATARTGCCNIMKRRCWDPNSSTVPSRRPTASNRGTVGCQATLMQTPLWWLPLLFPPQTEMTVPAASICLAFGVPRPVATTATLPSKRATAKTRLPSACGGQTAMTVPVAFSTAKSCKQTILFGLGCCCCCCCWFCCDAISSMRSSDVTDQMLSFGQRDSTV